MDADELDPGLNGHVRERVGQQRPRPLSSDEFLACRRDISPVQGHAGSHRADEGRRVAVLDPGLAQRHVRGRRGPRPGSIRRVPSPAAIARTARRREPSGAPASSRCRPHRRRTRRRRRGHRKGSARSPAERGFGVMMLSAANLRTASSASARICLTPRRHNMARSRAAHASAEGSSGRAASPYCQRSTVSAHRSASTGRAVSADTTRPAPRPSGASRSRPDLPATRTTAGRW